MNSLFKNFLICLALVVFVPACDQDPERLEKRDPMIAVRENVREKYAQVSHIGTDTLADWLKLEPGLVLVDVREKEEFEVSHLAGARSLPPASNPAEILRDVPESVTIVAYCSVGYRSSEMAIRLRKAGWANVYNLDGSIFQWANEGKPLYPGHKTPTVHPYDKQWGKLLHEELLPPVP